MSFGKNYNNPVSIGIFAPNLVDFTYTESERKKLSLECANGKKMLINTG